MATNCLGETTIGALLARDGGNVKTGPFGTTLKAKEYSKEGVPLISVGEIGYGALRIKESTPRAPPEVVERLPEYVLQAGDIVFGRKGAVDRLAMVKPEQAGWFLGSDGIRLRLPSTCDARFIAYQLQGHEARSWLLQHATGTTMASLNQSTIERLPIVLPPLADQRAIAYILGTLDDKIELNRRMNETLEAMARALFKSWFVDFDPVRAKMEGRDTGLPQDIADLFPDRLVDSEMGEIPEGWEVASLGDVAALRRKGIDPASEASDTPYIGLADMPRGSIALTDWGETESVSSRKSAFKAGDILFGKLRPYFHKVGIAPVDGLCSTDIVVLGARKPKWSAFVLACVSSSAFVAHTSQTATGTKMPRTSWQAMRRYELGRPTDTMASEFQRTVSPMLRRIVSNIHESRTLTALRDALLPKLISGEIRVPEVARALESVT